MLEMKSVSTSYGPVPMLRDVSLHVGPGEMVCLLGPNGAGKSTTFNAICGLLRSDVGSIRIAGKDVKESGTERLASLGAGFVPEGRRLFPTLTVRENLRLGFDAARNAALDFNAQIDRMADLFPRIRERLGQKAGTMSGGEQAMVALARALIGDPALVVMDEPSLGLSPKLIDEYFQIVARIRNEGKAVLLIEQNAETALSIAERGYLLIRGQIVLSGQSSELLKDDTIRHLYL
ncbi:ABC transporter ATP-binding protein [Ensifer sp. Root31]|jgi:branched-chain amino acid transport system ATP-binding protein|uniref:ABC transporter ATP-binding protein n=1 Tax=Ensifer TaxID=106591 RepID=UPI000709CC8F|nr:ABC transporter ATP-binding protein [Ensifer sp. Root31]KQU94681.1 ABC transporter ATP-binding protein [Ensifer sp. Root31]